MKPDMVSIWPPTELAESYFYETVRENYTIEEAGRVIHIYYVNPLQHAEGMLMVYLPEEKLLVQSDIVNTNNPLPAMPTRDQQTLLTEVTRFEAGCRADRADPWQADPVERLREDRPAADSQHRRRQLVSRLLHPPAPGASTRPPTRTTGGGNR